MGFKKYVIEIEKRPTNSFETHPDLYRAKGFRALVFDEVGLKKLKPFDEAVQEVRAEAYEDGVSYAEGLIDLVDIKAKEFLKGMDAGREEMKLTVLQSMGVSPSDGKCKPECRIFESCLDCVHCEKPGWANPCVDCRHSHKDYFEAKVKE